MSSIMKSGAFAAAAGLLLAAPAFAQNASQDVMKDCGAKWQAAKAANTAGNQTWPQFLTKCRAEAAQKPAASPAAATPAAATPAATPAGAKPAAPAAAQAAPAAKPIAVPQKPAAAAATPAKAVFPAKIDPKYASEKPGQQRQKTCVDQYNINKGKDNGAGNAGLKWIEKGGGYWSLCNKHLGGGQGA